MMSATVTMPPAQMNWNIDDSAERRFRLITTLCVVAALLLGVVLNMLRLPAPERRAAEVVPPHLAQIVLERKKVEPPKVVEPPKPVEPEKLKPEDIKPEVKAPQEKKPEPKPVEPPPTAITQPPPQPQIAPEAQRAKNVEAARQKAASSGVLAMKDMLADLREAAPAETIQQPSQQLQSGGATASSEGGAPSRSILTAKASKGSGGIDTSGFSRNTGGGRALAGHETETVTSRLDNLPVAKAQKREEEEEQQTGGRSGNEVERVIQANKGSIDTIYQRALRQNPALQGAVVFKLTIAPSGEVTDCSIVSSELGDEELERKLILRIKRLDFGARNVTTFIGTYPIRFMPP